MSAFHRTVSFELVGEFSLLLGSTQPASAVTQGGDNCVYIMFFLSNYTTIAKLLSESGKRGSEMDLNFLLGVWELRQSLMMVIVILSFG